MKALRLGIVVSRFNEEITSRLLDSCLKTLAGNGVPKSAVAVVFVPGGFEIPWAAQELALSQNFDAVIALGCILKGETPQNDHISSSTYRHLQEISLKTRVPCVTGILTPNTYAQAKKRTRGAMDRGAEAAHAALEMAKLKRGGF